MGNSAEKGSHGFASDDEYNGDTIARDFTYKSFKKSEARTPLNRSRSVKDSSSGSRKKSVTRSNSSRRRPSFKAKRTNSVRGKLLFRSASKERGVPSFLISDMEVQVDGKVAKLVPRKSILRKMDLPVITVKDKESKSRSTKKGIKSRPKDSMRITSTQHLKESEHLKLSKRPSYEAAMTSAANSGAAKDSNISAVPKHMVKHCPNQNKRWSNVDFTPSPKNQRKSRPNSAHINISNNNNNIKSGQSEFAAGIWRIDNLNDKAKKRWSGHEMYKEISGEMSKLALVSPITDV